MEQDNSHNLVKKSSQYQSWKRRVLQNKCEILHEEIRCVIQRDSQSFYSAMIDVTLLTPEQNTISRCMVLRGPSAVVIPILTCGKLTKTLMVQQRRIVNGALSLEFPSGGVDLDIDPRASAVREIREELRLDIKPEELFELCAEPLVVCDSLLDEVVYWYYFRKEIPEQTLRDLEGKKTGESESQEHITLRVLAFSEVHTAQNFQSLVGLQLLRQNQIEV